MSESIITEITPRQGATNDTLIGDVSTYIRHNEAERRYEINARINPRVETENWFTLPYPVRETLISTERPPTVGSLIADLVSANNRMLEQVERSQRFADDAYRALEIISERLNTEAERRGWCDEFDRIIDEVNDDLPGNFALTPREKEYEVEWTETFTVTVSRSATYTARNEEEAQRMAEEEDIDSSDLIDAIRMGDWESDYSSPDYEIREV